jgi:uncharacterized sulfatase
LEGRSLLPLLRSPETGWEKPAFTFLRRGQVLGASLRTERFRYTEWDQGRQGAELYDHQNDPGEIRNLAAQAAHAGTVGRLRPLLRAQLGG